MIIKLNEPIKPVLRELDAQRVRRVLVDYPADHPPVHRISIVFGYMEGDTFVEDTRVPAEEVSVEGEVFDMTDYISTVRAAKLKQEADAAEANAAEATAAEAAANLALQKAQDKVKSLNIRSLPK